MVVLSRKTTAQAAQVKFIAHNHNTHNCSKGSTCEGKPLNIKVPDNDVNAFYPEKAMLAKISF